MLQEVKTCGNRWGEIDYNKVSSNANKRYLNAFKKHDGARYLDSLYERRWIHCNVVGMHADVLLPT